MRICILGQYGWGNCGDEGILQAIIDDLGLENEYIVKTSLPFNLIGNYTPRLPQVEDVRTIDDSRTDFDILLLGGGKIDWGFAWQAIFNAYSADIPLAMYGVALRTDVVMTEILSKICGDFLRMFDLITVRDKESERLAEELFAQVALTMCPAINLKEEYFPCPRDMIAVCPRYSDYDANGKSNNQDQIDWIVEQVKDEADNVMIIPFAPFDVEGKALDWELCKQIMTRLQGKVRCQIIEPFRPKRVKYAISRCKKVVSGGRYHAVVWAAAHEIPFSAYPMAKGIVRTKIDGFNSMIGLYGKRQLKEMELRNKQLLKAIIDG